MGRTRRLNVWGAARAPPTDLNLAKTLSHPGDLKPLPAYRKPIEKYKTQVCWRARGPQRKHRRHTFAHMTRPYSILMLCEIWLERSDMLPPRNHTLPSLLNLLCWPH